MRPIDFLRAIFYPVTQPVVLISIVVFALLLSFARWGGVLGFFLMFLVLPAVFRFQMIILEARAQGREPSTPDVEFFNWFGNAWSLFPLVLVAILVAIIDSAGKSFGAAGTFVALLFAGGFLPASLVVLAITHSSLQSLNPKALGDLLKRSRATFWVASVYLIVVGWLMLQVESLPLLAANLIVLFLVYSFSCLTGSLIEPYDLIDDVHIPDALELGADELAGNIEKARNSVLTHAYGFMSRGNREGGFRHVIEQIGADPDPVAAWAWFFDRMLLWEDRRHALFFAQHYIHDMLQYGEKIPALKVIQRCRLIDEQFKPKNEDLPAAIEAADSCGNIQLSAVLKRL